MSVHWEAASPVILQLYTLKLNVLERPALYTVRLMSFLFDDNIVFMIWAQIHLAFTKSEFKNKGWRNFSCTWRKQKLGNKIFLMTYWNTELMYLIHRKKKKDWVKEKCSWGLTGYDQLFVCHCELYWSPITPLAWMWHHVHRVHCVWNWGLKEQ